MKTEAGWPRGCALMNCSYWDNEKGYCTVEGQCIYNDQGCEENAMVADGLRSRIKALEAENENLRTVVPKLPGAVVLVDRDLLEMCIDLLRGEKPIDATKAAESIRRVIGLLKETP